HLTADLQPEVSRAGGDCEVDRVRVLAGGGRVHGFPGSSKRPRVVASRRSVVRGLRRQVGVARRSLGKPGEYRETSYGGSPKESKIPRTLTPRESPLSLRPLVSR